MKSILLFSLLLPLAAFAGPGSVVPVVKHGTDAELAAGTDTKGQAWSAEQLATLGGGSVAVGDITGLGTGVATALAVNVGTAGAPVVLNGALGTPSSGVGTNITGLPIANLAAGVMAVTMTLGENTSIALDPASSVTDRYSGITITGTAGATLAFGDFIVLDVTDSRWELADANSAAAADGDARGLCGICVLAAAADGSATTILVMGVVRADTAFPTFTVTAPVYISETAGDLTSTQPVTADVVIRIVGSALTADEILFMPGASWTTHL